MDSSRLGRYCGCIAAGMVLGILALALGAAATIQFVDCSERF